MFRFKINNLALFATIAAITLGVGCGVPAEVEGEVLGEAFAVRDDSPEFRVTEATGEATIVLAEEDGDSIRTLVMVIPAETNIEVGVPVPLVEEGSGKEGIFMELSEGLLEEIVQGDTRIINAKDPDYFNIIGGTVVFDSLSDPISGTFVAEIEGGGVIRGSFVIDGSLR